MKIQFELTEKDYIDFNMNYMTTSPAIKRSIFIQRYIISIIYLVAPFIITKITGASLWHWFPICLTVYIVWVTFYARYYKMRVKKHIEKLLTEGKSIGVLGKHSISLTKNGIIAIKGLSKSKMNWSSVQNISETKEHIYIFIGSIEAYMIPLRAFLNEDDKIAFLNKLNEYSENKLD